MAKDVSNKTLAMLVGVAVIVSVVGLFIGAPARISGLVGDNETGYVTANVQSDIELTLVDDWIYLGSLRNLDTNSSDHGESNDNMTINNSGATTVDVNYWGSDSIWNYDCGGSDTANQTDNVSDCYQLKVMDNGGGTTQGSYASYQNVVLNHTGHAALIHDLPSAGVFTVGVNVTVPAYEPSGTSSNVSLNFDAVES